MDTIKKIRRTELVYITSTDERIIFDVPESKAIVVRSAIDAWIYENNRNAQWLANFLMENVYVLLLKIPSSDDSVSEPLFIPMAIRQMGSANRFTLDLDCEQHMQGKEVTVWDARVVKVGNGFFQYNPQSSAEVRDE